VVSHVRLMLGPITLESIDALRRALAALDG
jgi:hypothetical protein